MSLGIGSTIWIYNENRRVYPKEGRGGPIWREHWEPFEIHGETSRSWITGSKWNPLKLDKKTLKITGRRVAVSEQHLDELEYVEYKAYEIGRQVQTCKSAALLRKIEALLSEERNEH